MTEEKQPAEETVEVRQAPDPDFSGETRFTDLTPQQRLEWLSQAVVFTYIHGGRAR